MENTFRVGYCRVAVNPEDSVPLGGMGNMMQRFHTRQLDDICVTCVALTDAEDHSIMIIGLDFVHSYTEVTNPIRDEISRVTGIDREHIFTTATHTHSGAALFLEDVPSVKKYNAQIIAKTVAAAKAAMEDRKPAKMFAGAIEARNLNFIKHYKARDNETGEISYIGDQFGTSKGKTLLDHATVVDPTMHLVKFVREGGKDVVLTNFRAHPHFTCGYKKYDLSADYIGAFRVALEAMVDCHGLYIQGACGNINSSTRLADERRYTTHQSYGLGLAATAVEGLAKYMKEVPTGTIRCLQTQFCGEMNQVPTHLIPKAKEISQVWADTHDRQLCEELGAPHGIRSPYHANAILTNLTRTKEKDGWLQLNAVSIGEELAFFTYPGEMFDSVGVRIEENSPYRTTLMVGYSQDRKGYLPSSAAYKYTSYETDTTRFAPGTGEQVADTYVAMLNKLKAEKE